MYNVSWCIICNGVTTGNAVCYSKQSAEQMRTTIMGQSYVSWCVITYAGE